MKIIEYRNYSDIDVEFLDDNKYIKRHVTFGSFKRGEVKNPYDKIVFGVGYIGEGNNLTKIDGKISKIYLIWYEIIERCYGNKEKYPSYYGISTVCEEWHCFHRFADWYENNKYECEGRLHIDKDILFPGNKLYSPNTCLLIPQRINMLFVNKSNKWKLPNGINKTSTCKFTSTYNGCHLGTFNTLDEAYMQYSIKKENTIKRIANEFRSVIPDKVYQALHKYRVDINNDKNYIVKTKENKN